MRNIGAQRKQHGSGALFRLQLPVAGEAVTDQQQGPSPRNDPSMTNTGADTGWKRHQIPLKLIESDLKWQKLVALSHIAQIIKQ